MSTYQPINILSSLQRIRRSYIVHASGQSAGDGTNATLGLPRLSQDYKEYVLKTKSVTYYYFYYAFLDEILKLYRIANLVHLSDSLPSKSLIQMV